MPATAKVESLIAGLLRLKGYGANVLLERSSPAIERIFRDTLSQLGFGSSRVDVDLISRYLDVNEFGLAFDRLCDSISARNLRLTSSDFKHLAELGLEVGAPPAEWEALADLVKD